MENLGIDWKLIVAQMVSFGVFFLVFSKYIANPLNKFLKEKKEQEELREKMAEELETRQAKLDEKDKEFAKKQKQQLEKALAQSKKDAELVKQEIISDAKKEAEKMVKQKEAEMEEEKEKMYQDMRDHVAQVSVMMVDKGLNQYLTPDAKKAVTKYIISNVPKTKI